MKVLAIIQARLSSRRFPNKILAQIPPGSGVSMLEMVVRKVLLAKEVDDVAVVTPDRMIAVLCNRWNVKAYMPVWTERDVVREFYEAAKPENMHNEKKGVIVRITADCPLLRPEEVDKCVQTFQKSDVDLVYNTDEGEAVFQCRGDGTDVEVMSFEALEKAFHNAKGDEREHVTLYIRRNLKTLHVPVDEDYAGQSVNTIDDYLYVLSLINKNRVLDSPYI